MPSHEVWSMVLRAGALRRMMETRGSWRTSLPVMPAPNFKKVVANIGTSLSMDAAAWGSAEKACFRHVLKLKPY